MTKEEAATYLGDTVAQYIENGYPLEHLTGEEGGGLADRHHVKKLRDALAALGYGRAPSLLSRKLTDDRRES